MKRILFFLSMLSFTPQLFSQSNFSVSFSTGLQSIKKDVGLNYDVGLSYRVSPKTLLNAEFLFAQLDKNEYSLTYEVQKYSINVHYGLVNDTNFGISSIMGFSYMVFEKTLLQDEHEGLGIDLGAKFSFQQNRNFDYGFKLLNTFNPVANGAIFQSNLFFTYRF